jgi:hypothetical protein
LKLSNSTGISGNVDAEQNTNIYDASASVTLVLTEKHVTRTPTDQVSRRKFTGNVLVVNGYRCSAGVSLASFQRNGGPTGTNKHFM